MYFDKSRRTDLLRKVHRGSNRDFHLPDVPSCRRAILTAIPLRVGQCPLHRSFEGGSNVAAVGLFFGFNV